MEVWQYPPQNNVIESLEWLTDIIHCRNGEFRACTRRFPRQEFSFQHQFDEGTYGLAREKRRIVGGSQLYVPDWPRMATIPAVNAGTVTLPVDTAHASSFKVGGAVLVIESTTLYEVHTVSDIGDGTITVSALTHSYSRPLVVPLRVGTFVQPLAGTRYASHYVTAHALFKITATEDMIDATATVLPTYLNWPVILSARELINSSEDSVDRVVETLDSATGGLANYSLYSYAQTSMSVALTAQTSQQAIDLRSLLATLCGRWKAFWLPSNNADFTLTKDIADGEDFVQVAAVGFAASYGLGTDIGILTKVGGIIGLRITSVTTEIPGNERLHFTSGAFAGNLAISLVDKVCTLTPSRLDADRIELQYKPGLVLTVVVPTQEVLAP